MADTHARGTTPNPLAPPDWPEIEHKDVDGRTRVHPRSVEHWEARGWKVVKGSAQPAPEADGTTKKGA